MDDSSRKAFADHILEFSNLTLLCHFGASIAYLNRRRANSAQERKISCQQACGLVTRIEQTFNYMFCRQNWFSTLMEGTMYSRMVANIPHDCESEEILSWIEAHGVRVRTLKVISDLVSRTSPEFARVQLTNANETDRAARLLDGQRLRKEHSPVVEALHPAG